jgi:phytanoyl-CoA hydroxylase
LTPAIDENRLAVILLNENQQYGEGDVKLSHLNHGFTWMPAPCKGGLIDAGQADFWNANGYLLLKGALDPAEIATVRDDIDRHAERKADALRAQGPQAFDINDVNRITFTQHIVLTSEPARRFAKNPVFARAALDLLADDVRLYWDQAVYKMPEPERDFPWHQDTGYAFNTPQHYLTCWVPLVDATLDNGCPWVAPGRHTLGTIEHWWTAEGWRCLTDAPDAVPVEAAVGDIVCFSSLTPHRTGPNVSDTVRKAYILQYIADPTTLTLPTATEPVLQNDPERQFFVARNGKTFAAGAPA